MTSNILETPQSIYEAVIKYFENPDVSIDITAEKLVTVKVKVTACQPEIIIRNIVDKREFKKTMQELSCKVQKKKLLGDKNPYKIDCNRFFVPGYLKDWQNFQRFKFEQSGKKCTQAIIEYLQDPEMESILSALGLAPSQVDKFMREQDIQYFRNIFINLENMQKEEFDLLLINFKEKYPNISQQVLDELVKEEHSQDLRKKKDDDEISKILEELESCVIGQKKATQTLAAALASQKNQDKNQVFLFVGPTGVGKTELAKAVSRRKSNRFVFFPMNLFASELDYSKFCGAGGGFVSSTDKPYFIKNIEKFSKERNSQNPSEECYDVENIVILFDEFEKTHSSIKQSLLTLLAEGHYSCGYTKTNFPSSLNMTVQYFFRRCLFICTSNLFSSQILEAFDKNIEPHKIAEIFSRLNSLQRDTQSFSSELLSRITIIPFGPIPKECFQQLMKSKLTSFIKSLKEEIGCKEILVENESLILNVLADKLYGKGIDLRRIFKYFEEIKKSIYFEKDKWGNLKKVKILFSCNQERQLFIEIQYYLKLRNIGFYHTLKNIPKLILI